MVLSIHTRTTGRLTVVMNTQPRPCRTNSTGLGRLGSSSSMANPLVAGGGLRWGVDGQAAAQQLAAGRARHLVDQDGLAGSLGGGELLAREGAQLLRGGGGRGPERHREGDRSLTPLWIG